MLEFMSPNMRRLKACVYNGYGHSLFDIAVKIHSLQ